MMRSAFDNQLSLLNRQLTQMGMLIETAIASSVEALTKRDRSLAEACMRGDDVIDDKEKEIESLCLGLLLRQQPVARDLRLISSALKMITDMERIGDQAADIAEVSLMLSDKRFIKELDDIPLMARETAKMVTSAIDAFVLKDEELAKKVILNDDEVDALFDKIKGELIELIFKDSANGEQAIDLIMIAKYFERIGDHAVNIAEWVLFSITGKHIEVKDMQV